MELIEAIRQRHSVRRYTGQPIDKAVVETLRSAIESANAESGLNIQLVLNEPKAFASKIHTYGTFSGVNDYLVMAAPKGKQWEEKIGYYGENQGVQHPLKPAEKFFEADGEVPEWFKAGLEAALLAPTAVNQQKFKFILHDGNKVETKTFFSPWGYTIIDLGIVKYHFEIGAGKEKFTWL